MADIISQDDFKSAIDTLSRNILQDERARLSGMSESDLETFWYFKYDHNMPIYINLYNFQDCLDMYRRKCRQWEEIHNGYVMVVERVRDKYLIPKIREFERTIEQIIIERNR